MNGVLSVRKVLWGLESQPQVLSLNQGVATLPLRSFGGAWCARREVSAPACRQTGSHPQSSYLDVISK